MSYYKKTKMKNDFYSSNKNLSELANLYETDKGTADKMSLSWGITHPDNYTLSYTQVYENYMKKDREKEVPVEFFEIGICDSRFPFASPKVWLSYFKNINLYCMDNFWGTSPSDENINYLNSIGVNFFYGDQGLESDWLDVANNISSKLDYIIEDGSHYPNHMVYSLWKSIPLLKSGGYYFMEDIQHQNTKGWYGYDNYSVNESIATFMSTGKFSSDFLSREACEQIESSYTIEHVHFGGPNHATTILCVFKKK